jgi:hypothetical protein
VSRRTVIAYWLIPAEPVHSFFQGVINDLAFRYDAPVFEPHLTIHVGANRAQAAETVISKAGQNCRQVELEVGGVGHSAEFTKTLFVQFALSTKLRHLNQIIRTAEEESSGYQLNPHLSLLYKTLSATARRELVDSIKTPFAEVVFDGLKAVRCISPTRSREDVEAWRVVAASGPRSIGV